MSEVSAAHAAASAPGPEADLGPLRPYWHPVAYSHELAGGPLSVVVLGEPVVLVRGDAEVHAFRDLCPHRGAKISMGWLRDDRLVCPYHGFQYDSEGRCRVIPSQPPDQQVIPSRLRLERFHATERHGLVWVALAEPRLPVGEFAELDDPAFYVHPSPTETWNTSAARWMENFLDITHFAHVHPGILADPADPVCEPYEVHETPTGLRYEYDGQMQLDPSLWPSAANHGAIQLEPTHFRHDLFLPFTLSIAADSADGTWTLFFAGLPVTATTVKVFALQARDYMRDGADDFANEVSHLIFEQDRPISEHQHPEMLPVDLTEEVHLRVGDAIGVAYRHKLREMGLTYA